MFRMKSVVGAVAVAAMVSTSALAAANEGALAPGKPAGVKNAALGTGALVIGAVGAGIIAAIAITVSNQNHDTSGKGSFSSATTSTTP